MRPRAPRTGAITSLTSTLYANGTANVTVNLAKTKYDVEVTGYYGYKSYFRNLDFTNAGTYGSMNITAADSCTLILDGVLASGTDSTVRLTVRNNTGNVITSIVYGSGFGQTAGRTSSLQPATSRAAAMPA